MGIIFKFSKTVLKNGKEVI